MKGNKKIEQIVLKNAIDILHTHGFIPDIVCSRVKKSKKIATIHNNMQEDYTSTYGNVKGLIYTKVHMFYLKKVDKIIYCSKSSFDSALKLYEYETYIRNGIDLEYKIVKNHNISRERLNIPGDAIIFIFVGRLNNRKRVEKLIRKFVENHKENEYLIVLGEGEKFDECLRKSDNHVLMLGFVNEVLNYLKISDIYISISESEGFSLSIIEALGNGLGLLLSDIPSHKEVFEINKNIYLGEIVKDDNFEEMLNKIRKNIKQIDKNAIIEFQKKYLSGNSMTSKYEKEYEDILCKK